MFYDAKVSFSKFITFNPIYITAKVLNLDSSHFWHILVEVSDGSPTKHVGLRWVFDKNNIFVNSKINGTFKITVYHAILVHIRRVNLE